MGKLSRMDEMNEEKGGCARRRAGVSMIEVVIALSILGFGMLGVAAAQIESQADPPIAPRLHPVAIAASLQRTRHSVPSLHKTRCC